jgi:16S rRNA (guanine527-N7)-methyltransferase
MEASGSDFKVIDVGSGAGLPGIPIKIVRQDVKVTLLEATTKKAQFLQYVIEKLGLEDIEAINGRAEEIAHQYQYRERYDIVLSRAVAALPVAVELALPFCIQGGRFIAQKKGDIEQEIRQSTRAIAEMGGELWDVKKVEIMGLNEGRKLVVIEKVKPTPNKYPRRPGMPAKRSIK